MKTKVERDYYVGRPGHKDPTARLAFGRPSLKPRKDWEWIQPPRRTAEPLPLQSSVVIFDGSQTQSRQIRPDVPQRNKPSTETAVRLREIHDQLDSIKATMGKRIFRRSEKAIALRKEYARLVKIRRKEKMKERGGGE